MRIRFTIDIERRQPTPPLEPIEHHPNGDVYTNTQPTYSAPLGFSIQTTSNPTEDK